MIVLVITNAYLGIIVVIINYLYGKVINCWVYHYENSTVVSLMTVNLKHTVAYYMPNVGEKTLTVIVKMNGFNSRLNANISWKLLLSSIVEEIFLFPGHLEHNFQLEVFKELRERWKAVGWSLLKLCCQRLYLQPNNSWILCSIVW